MALELINGVFPTIFQYSVEPIKRNLGYVFNYEKKVETFKNRVEELAGARERMQHSVDDARRGGEEIENDVKKWLLDVDRVIEEAEKLIGCQEQVKEKCFVGLCPNFKGRYRISKKVEKEALRIFELRSNGRFDRISYRAPLQQLVTVKNGGILRSRESILRDVMDALTDTNVDMVGVYGMAGVGKSTFVKEVHRRAMEDKLFDVAIMVTVSEKPEIGKIQGNIADMLGLKFDEETEVGRACRLRQRLMVEGKILIVLDNIWAQLELEAIGIPSGDEHKGCKILLTSRSRDVLSNDMDVQKLFRLEVLLEDEALVLFEMMVGGMKNHEFLSIATEVVKNCAGLPVLIVTIARALKNKDLYVWRDAVKQLSRHDNEPLQDKVYSALELSYDHLVGSEVKSLFLLCGLLGKSDILVLDLLMYCVGLGLFSGIDALEDARNRLHKLVSDLKASCLLLDSDLEGSVKIHDAVRDVAISIASRMQHVFTVRKGARLKKWPDKEMLKNCSRISLPYNEIHELPEALACPGLELFLLFTEDLSLKVPDIFFEGIRKLKVLNFTGMHFSSLPQSLGFLENLRMLCLDGCILHDMGIIGELKGLEILSIKYSDIVELPLEIKQLTRLKFLDLSHCSKLKVLPPNVLSKLSLLEELYMRNSFVLWDVEGPNKNPNASLVELTHLSYLTTLEICVLDSKILPKDLFSKKLERFSIFIGDVWVGGNFGETSRTLKLKLNKSIHLEHGLKLLMKMAEEVCLNEVNGIKNILYDLDSEGLTQLKHLDIQNVPEIQYIINPIKWVPCNAFPILESLYLTHLMSLEKICHGKLYVGSFSELRSLIVVDCNKLKNLFSFTMIKCLTRLQTLKVVDCTNVEEIVADENEDSNKEDEALIFTQLCLLTLKRLPQLKMFCSKTKKPLLSPRTTTPKHSTTNPGLNKSSSEGEPSTPLPLFGEMVFFPKLETMNLSLIPCENVWNPQLSAISSNLSSLIVEGCPNLKYLFTSPLHKNLLRLRRLEVCDCESMEGIVIPGECEEEKRTHMILFPELEFLKLKNLPNTTKFCVGLPIECHSLKKLLIENCPVLNTFVSRSQNPENMGCKEHENMSSDHLPRIQPLFNEKVSFPRLEEMELSYIDNIKEIWHSKLSGGSFCHLKVMRLNGFKHLESIFPSNLLERFQRVEKLSVSNCYSLQEIYPLQGLSVGDDHVMTTFGLRELYIRYSPELNHVWSNDPQKIFTFQNLQIVDVSLCRKLEYLFPASIACNLLQLEKLVLKKCNQMNKVVADIEIGGAPCFMFPQLTLLELSSLPKIKSFYPGLHSSEWPKLKWFKLFDCNEVRKFALEFFYLQGIDAGDGQNTPLQPSLSLAEKGQLGISPSNSYAYERHLDPIKDASRYVCEDDLGAGTSSIFSGEKPQQLNNDKLQEISFDMYRHGGSLLSNDLSDKRDVSERTEEINIPSCALDDTASCATPGGRLLSEDPGVEGFQIVGTAFPGNRLLGCGYPVRGTSSCMFQWFWQHEDGSRQDIEGATFPEYMVTAKDVNQLIGIECVPLDDKGNKGRVVTAFANDLKKIKNKVPRIEGFQIDGRATPGGRLLASGYSASGTSACFFQWFRQHEDGYEHYVKGATDPHYDVTADDVDKLIAVACIPHNDEGLQGKLMILFANDQNKVQCDSGMQSKIDTYISLGEATFGVLLQVDSSDNWEPATLILRQAGYQIKGNDNEVVLIVEKFSKDLAIEIPYGLSKQFVLSSSYGSHTLSASNYRMRDIIVLTMRKFQSKLLNSFKALNVENCEALEELFDMEGPNAEEGNVDVGIVSQLNELHLIKLPRLRRIWKNNNPVGVLGFKSLILLKIHDCNSLTSIFTPSIALGLVQLQSIEVKRCSLVEEIIAKEEEHALLGKIILPSLYYINLESLPSLISIYSGSGAITFPSHKINLVDCPNIDFPLNLQHKIHHQEERSQ